MPVCLLLNIYHLFNVVSSPRELDSASHTPPTLFLFIFSHLCSFSTHLSDIILAFLMFSSEVFGMLYFLAHSVCVAHNSHS